jgi:hypothetical protein
VAEQSKFAGALGRLKNKPGVPAQSGDEQPIPRPLQPGKARLTGKRSDPEYSPTTFFVRKETKRKATQLLLDDVNSKTDLSDLVEQLLAKWVSEHSHV